MDWRVFLTPDRQVSEDDNLLSSSNHLLKLVFARNAVEISLHAAGVSGSSRFCWNSSWSEPCRTRRFHGSRLVRRPRQEPETQVEIQVSSHFGWVKGLRPLARLGTSGVIAAGGCGRRPAGQASCARTPVRRKLAPLSLSIGCRQDPS